MRYEALYIRCMALLELGVGGEEGAATLSEEEGGEGVTGDGVGDVVEVSGEGIRG